MPVHEARAMRPVHGQGLADDLLAWSRGLDERRVSFEEYQLDEHGEILYVFTESIEEKLK